MITADISNLETKVKLLITINDYFLQSRLSLPLCTNISLLFIANFFLHASLYGMFFNTRECPMCGFKGKHME